MENYVYIKISSNVGDVLVPQNHKAHTYKGMSRP